MTLLSIAATLLLISGPAFATLTMKCGHVAPPFHGQSKGIEAFAEYVKEKTGNAVEIQTFPFGQLGGETSLADQVQSGTLEMATVSVSRSCRITSRKWR